MSRFFAPLLLLAGGDSAYNGRMDFRAGKSTRIRKRDEIARMFAVGARAGGPKIMLIGLENPGARPRARTGVAVAKKIGNAPTRNRVKRLCREAARLVRNDLPGGWDFLIVPRVGAEQNLRELMAAIKTQAAKITATKKRPGRSSVRPGGK